MIQGIRDHKSKEINENREIVKELYKIKADYDNLFIKNMRDFLTWCFNRKGLQYYETTTLEEAKKEGNRLFVCVIDLNGFKHLYDTYGHEAGDIKIKAVADAIKASLPKDSKIIRTEGDELLVFSALESGSKEPEEMGGKIQQYLKEYNDTYDNPFDVAASYGYILRQ